MRRPLLLFSLLSTGLSVLQLCVLAADLPITTAKPPVVSDDPNDWPMYNHDVIGTRHNPTEKALSRENVGQLVEKWRFPPQGSGETVGVVHATVVVNGHVYFGTETTPTFYKLTPDGKVKWAYRPPPRPLLSTLGVAVGLPTKGFINAALVTSGMVYVGDMGGMIYALDRMTGNERWKIDTRAAPFPGAHSSNCVFSAPAASSTVSASSTSQ